MLRLVSSSGRQPSNSFSTIGASSPYLPKGCLSDPETTRVGGEIYMDVRASSYGSRLRCPPLPTTHASSHHPTGSQQPRRFSRSLTPPSLALVPSSLSSSSMILLPETTLSAKSSNPTTAVHLTPRSCSSPPYHPNPGGEDSLQSTHVAPYYTITTTIPFSPPKPPTVVDHFASASSLTTITAAETFSYSSSSDPNVADGVLLPSILLNCQTKPLSGVKRWCEGPEAEFIVKGFYNSLLDHLQNSRYDELLKLYSSNAIRKEVFRKTDLLERDADYTGVFGPDLPDSKIAKGSDILVMLKTSPFKEWHLEPQNFDMQFHDKISVLTINGWMDCFIHYADVSNQGERVFLNFTQVITLLEENNDLSTPRIATEIIVINRSFPNEVATTAISPGAKSATQTTTNCTPVRSSSTNGSGKLDTAKTPSTSLDSGNADAGRIGTSAGKSLESLCVPIGILGKDT